MEEYRAARESMTCNQANGIYRLIDGYFLITNIIVTLLSFRADNLIYVHNEASCYNKCKFASSLEAHLKPLRMSIRHDC